MTNQPNKKEALGKGIRSLLQHIDDDLKSTTNSLGEKVISAATSIERIPIDQIEVNPKQPRRDFDDKALDELSQSIKQHDLIQPITVSRLNNKKYRLIAGERRLRASKIAGLKDIPAYIRQANDRQLLELALMENLHRENLNAIETALSFKRLMEECDMNQEQVADRIGKDRTTVTNYIRLLKLPPDIQIAVRNGNLTMGHARAIINIEKVEQQLYIFNEILLRHLSVRQTEELVRKISHGEKRQTPKISGEKLPSAYQQIEDKLTSHFATRVKLLREKGGKGNITIDFYSDDDLNRILDMIQLSGR